MPDREHGTTLAWYSLRWRVPLLFSSLAIVIVAAFLWVTYREVERNLRDTARERAVAAADQIAAVLSLSTQQRTAELRRIAGDAAVRDCVATRTEQACAAAQSVLSRLGGNGPTIVELWTASGERTLAAAFPAATNGAMSGDTAPSAAGLHLRVQNHVVLSEVVVDVVSSAPDAHSTPRPPGFLVVRRPAAVTPTRDVLSRLVGGGASVEIGDRTARVWTDLAAEVAGPPIELTRGGFAEYGADDGRRLGSLSEIHETPWVVWVEFPEHVVLAPAAAFLKRMLMLSAAFVALSTLAVSVASSRITTPLYELTRASGAIAAGDYSQRVATERRDEIGRLGASFNRMAARVAADNRTLESHAQQRTEALDRFFSLSLDLLCIAGLDGRFQRLNPAWQETLGWTIDELTAVPYVDFVHPDDVSATAAEAGKLASGETTLKFENRYRCKDGSYRWLSWKAIALPESGAIFAAARDITEQKRIANELQDRVAELGVVNQELEAFSYSVSHDLRAPLRHISGFAALLRQAADDADRRRHIDTIIAAAAHMGLLIDDLLTFSRVGRASLQRTRVDLNRLAREARDEAVDGNGHEVRWRVGDLPVVNGDPALLRLVFDNLFSNALKYSAKRDRPQIEVGALTDRPREVVVFVRDNGVGFDMQYAHKLFGVFQRLHRAEEFEGTGIGLANVRRIVQRHGGRTWAEAAVGHGATFYFSLPHLAGQEVS